MPAIDFVHSVSGNARYLDADGDGLTAGTPWIPKRKSILQLAGTDVSSANPLPVSVAGRSTAPLTTIAIDQTGTGDLTLLAPTAGKAIALYGMTATFSIEVAEITLRAAANAAFAKLLNLVSFSISDDTYPITLGVDEALIMNVGATSVRSTGFLRYTEV